MLKAIEETIEKLRQLRSVDVRTIDIDKLVLRQTSYVEVFPGVRDRLLTGRNDILFPHEELARHFVQRLVFSDSKKHIICSVDAEVDSGWHRHPQDEEITVITGKCVILLDGREITLMPGMSIAIPPLVPHSAYNPEASLMIISAY